MHRQILAATLIGTSLASAATADIVTTAVNNGDWLTAATWDNNQPPSGANDYVVDVGTLKSIVTTSDEDTNLTFPGLSLDLNGNTFEIDATETGNPVDTHTRTIHSLTATGGAAFDTELRNNLVLEGSDWSFDGTVSLRSANVTNGNQLNAAVESDADTVIQVKGEHASQWQGQWTFGGDFLSSGDFLGTIQAGYGSGTDARGFIQFASDVDTAFFHLVLYENGADHGRLQLTQNIDISVLSLTIGSYEIAPGTYTFGDFAAYDTGSGDVDLQDYFGGSNSQTAAQTGGTITVVIPEPSSLALFSLAFAGLFAFRRFRT